jgi:thioredoxin-like negative regulator of GroEL
MLTPPPVPSHLLQVRHVSVMQLCTAAQALCRNGEYEHAAAIFRYLLAARSRHPSVLFGLARCHLELGQTRIAARITEAAAELARRPATQGVRRD